MGRWSAVFVIAVFALVLGACGGGEEVSDSDIVDAAGLEEGSNGAAYTVGGDPFEVGQVFARRWMARLTDGANLGSLSTEYPRIPHRIDGELLRYAARFGLLAHKDDQIDEHDRYAIRAGFWREVDARTSSERAPEKAPERGPDGE